MTKNQTLERLLDLTEARMSLKLGFGQAYGATPAYFKVDGALDRVVYDLKEDVKKYMKKPSERKRRKRA